MHLITGATGNVGSLVTERLLALGQKTRVFVRDREKAQSRFGDRVDIQVGDLADGDSLSRAFAGVDVVFLINSGPEIGALDALAADVARRAGVRRLVKLSSYD